MPKLLSVNQVPLLRHGEVIVRESVAILVYLDSLYTGWRLFGSTSQEKAVIWQQVCEVENLIVPYLRQFVRPLSLKYALNAIINVEVILCSHH